MTATRPGRDAHLVALLAVAGGPHRLLHEDGEPDDREDVHGLVAREHPVGNDGVRLGSAHRSQRIHDAGDDHDHDAGHQKRREHLAHHIDDARGPQGQ